MAETGKDILMQERGGTKSKTVNTRRNSYKRNFTTLILEMDFNHPDLTDREKNNEIFSDVVKSKFLIY